ncbi:hypothetical protein PSHT_08137, partial [Puccinia striiformis]
LVGIENPRLMATLKICDPDHPDHEAARASLIRKVDWHVLPGLSLLWLACFIDRTNIGNAKVGGMDHSLGLHGMQYNIGLAVFIRIALKLYVESPRRKVLNLSTYFPHFLRRGVEQIWLPFLVASWGKDLPSVLKDHHHFFWLHEELRIPYRCKATVRRNELQLRVGIFFASASLSGAFGGLLAYGIEMMEGLSGQKASLETASFLTPEEREFAVARLKFVPKLNQKTLPLEVEEAQADSLTSTQGADVDADAGATAEDKTAPTPRDLTRFETEKPLPLLNPDVKVGHETDGSSPVEKFEKYEIIRAFKEPQVWFTGIGYMSLCVGMYSYSLFL